MKVHCNRLDIVRCLCFALKAAILVTGFLFALVHIVKIAGNTDSLRSTRYSRPPHSDRTQLPHHKNVAPGSLDPPALGPSPVGGVVAVTSVWLWRLSRVPAAPVSPWPVLQMA